MGKIVPEHHDTDRPAVIVFSTVAVCVAIIWMVLTMDFGEPVFPDENARVADGAVLFIGSSTIARFPLGDSFPGKRCSNLGAGNENAIQLRERLARELPARVNSAGIVLYAGSADLRFEPSLPATEIRKRVEAVVGDLRSRFRGQPLLLLQVLPARSQSNEERNALRALNQELESLARELSLVFVRTNRPPLVDERGDLVESVSTDRHHLNLDGYRVLARWIVEDGGAVSPLLR